MNACTASVEASIEPNIAWIAGGLSCIAGMVDVISWITLSGLFTAHVTGNLVVMAADGVAGRSMHLASAIAVPLFIIITAIVGVAVERLQPSARHKLLVMLMIQTLLLAVCAALAILDEDGTDIWIAVSAITAMAAQNVLLHLSLSPVPTTAVMTGNIVTATLAVVGLLTSSGPARDAATKKWRQTAPVIVGFLAGCVCGACATAWFHQGAWLVPVALSALMWLGLGTAWLGAAVPPQNDEDEAQPAGM